MENNKNIYLKSKMSHPYYLVFFILLFSVLSFPIKAFTSQLIGGALPTIFCILLIIYYLAYFSKHTISLKFNKYDIPFILLMLYCAFHIVYSYVSQNVIYKSLQDYRIHILAGVIYLFVRNELSLNENNRKRIYNILTIIFLIVLSDIVIESIMRNIFRLDLSTLPWVEKMPQIGSYTFSAAYGFRIPTILGTPHKAGLIAVVSVVFFYYLYRSSSNKLYLLAVIFGIMGVVLSNSRNDFITLLIIMILLRKEKVFMLTNIIFLCIFVFGLSFVFLKYSSEVKLIYYTIYEGIAGFIGLIDFSYIKLVPYSEEPLWSINNIATYLFGIGVYTVVPSQDVFVFYKIETAVLYFIVERGLVFILLFLSLMYYPLKNRKINMAVKYAILMVIPFYLVMVHYWSTLYMGVYEIFIAMYALLISELINSKKVIE